MTKILDCAFNVHRGLGPGLLESAYEHCLHHELVKRNFQVYRQHVLPVVYTGERLDCGYRLDLWIEQKVIIEVKSVVELHPIYEAQVQTYLKLTKNKLGAILNFNVPLMKHGIHRVANRL